MNDVDDRPAPPGDWLTDRNRWRRRIATIILVCGAALVVKMLSRKAAEPMPIINVTTPATTTTNPNAP